MSAKPIGFHLANAHDRLGRFTARTVRNLLVHFSLALLAATLACAAESDDGARGNVTTVAPEAKSVKVTTRRDGDETLFYVENDELCEVTMTFDMALVNLKGSTPFPATMTFPARKVTEAFSLTPMDPAARWEFSYTNYYKLGSNCAKHDDAHVYQLPYAPGHAFKVTQGYNGSFSHKGSNKYAIDWKMPEGTPVFAARGGLVVKVKDDSNRGGSNMSFDKYNNFVLIRHDDGTLAHYCHLQQGGCLVTPGQMVRAGDLIAHSGNTGFSSGPHLHFCVFKTSNGRERESIPVRFQTAEQSAITLREGRNYKATPLVIMSAELRDSKASHQGAAGP